jgi:hypothetical protein
MTFSTKLKVSASKSATSPSCGTLALNSICIDNNEEKALLERNP